MGFDDRLRFAKLPWVQADRNCQVNLRRQPEFRFAIWVRHVNVDTRLLAEEEEKTELAFT